MLTLLSDDPDEGTITVVLRGEGIVPPDIEVSPAAIDESLFSGTSITVPLTIRNTGGSVLTWTADVASRSSGTVLAASQAFPDTGLRPPQKDVASEVPPPPPSERLFVQAAGAAASGVRGPETDARNGALEDVRAALEERHGSVTSWIPNRFDFSEGVTGTFISDGDYDMYDAGNFLSTDLGGSLTYFEFQKSDNRSR